MSNKKNKKNTKTSSDYWGDDDYDSSRGIRREMRKSKRKREKQIVRDMMHDPNNDDLDIEEGDW